MSDIPARDFVLEGAGGAPSVASIDVVALYDPRDGRVAHMHHSITFKGAERSRREVQERNAVETARRLGCNVDELKVLHVPDFDTQGTMFRVDVEKQVLIELEATSALDEYHRFAARRSRKSRTMTSRSAADPPRQGRSSSSPRSSSSSGRRA